MKKLKVYLFVTSLLPLWVLIILYDTVFIIENCVNLLKYDSLSCKNFFSGNYIEVVTVIIILLAFILSDINVNKFLNEKKSNNYNSAKILSVKKANKLAPEFLMSYILPLVAFDFSNLKGVLLFVVFICILGVICIKYENIYTSIFFEFKGYSIYLCDLQKTLAGNKVIYRDCIVLSKDDLYKKIRDNIIYYDFANDVYISY